jgi:predicted RNA-binding protein YlxR (DUF448 family)/ribosomal protein L7Ae-like RNA K-turn-binding protein
MNETATHMQTEAPGSEPPRQLAPHGGRARTCVGCGEHVEPDSAADLVRLVVNDGEVAVDGRGGGFGRGAHVHARPDCLRRAVERGLSRSAKARIHTIHTEAAAPAGGTAPLSVQSLAQAIQRSMDRRIEGLLISAARSKRVALGSDAVTGASQRGEAELVVVATDAAAARDLTAVRRAVTEGRAVAWASKDRLGELLSRSGSSLQLAVLSVSSRSIASSLRDAAQIVDACAAIAAGKPVPNGAPPEGQGRRARGTRPNPTVAAEGGKSQSAGACAPPPEGGKLDAPKGDAAPQGDGTHRDRGWDRGRGGAPRMAERAPAEDRAQGGHRAALGREHRQEKPDDVHARANGARRAAGPASSGPSRGRRSEG